MEAMSKVARMLNTSENTESQTSTEAKQPRVVENLLAAADTYRDRGKLYGDNYKRIGKISMDLFPEGVPAHWSKEALTRHANLMQVVWKLTRYTEHMRTHNGEGCSDSAHDMGVYSFMLEELT